MLNAERLNQILKDKETHQDYDRTVELAKDYFDLFSGNDISRFMRKVVTREDDVMFNQRMTIYESSIPSIVNEARKLFKRAMRSNQVYSSIDTKNTVDYNKIIDGIDKFFTSENAIGVDAYLQERWDYLVTYDPNAFISVELGIDESGSIRSFPFEYRSDQVYNYEFVNGNLDWIIFRIGNDYILYHNGQAERYEYIEDEKNFLLREGQEIFWVYDENNKPIEGYIKTIYILGNENINIKRVGYLPDPITNGRTMVSNLHYGLPFLKKEIKTGSEFDLTMALHAFPQKVQVGEYCEGTETDSCMDGFTDVNRTQQCSVCKGTRVKPPVHTSAQDIIFIPPPRGKDEPYTNPADFIRYFAPSIDLVKFQYEYQDKITENFMKAIFGSQAVTKTTINKTATEIDLSMESTYDTLYPFNNKYSQLWTFIVRSISENLQIGSDVIIYHSFPKDLKMKTAASILAEAKLVTETGLSQHAKNALNDDYLEIMYADDKDTLIKLRIKDKFYPFSGKTEQEVRMIINSGEVTRKMVILYNFFDDIFDDIDNEIGDRFYIMPYSQQKEQISNKVQLIMNDIDEERAGNFRAGIEDEL